MGENEAKGLLVDGGEGNYICFCIFPNTTTGNVRYFLAQINIRLKVMLLYFALGSCPDGKTQSRLCFPR